VKLTITSSSTNCTVAFESTSTTYTIGILLPIGFAVASILVCCTSFQSMFQSFKVPDMFFLGSVSSMSLTFLSLVHFLHFAVFVTMSLLYELAFMQFLMIAGVSALLCSMLINKFSMTVFYIHNINHPRINDGSAGSPRGRFYLVNVLLMIGVFISSFMYFSYSWFAYVEMALYLFPLIHVFRAFLKGNKNSFKW